MPIPNDASRPAEVSLVELGSLFGRIGLTSFGGGLSAWLYREAVTQRQWLTDEEFLSALTLSQILPGSNVVNLSIYLGQRLRGGVGSVTAVCSLLVPPMIVIVLLASLFQHFAEIAWLHDLLEGVAAGAVGMTAAVGVRTARATIVTQRWPLVLIAGVFIAVGLLRWPLVPVALVFGGIGLLIAWKVRPDPGSDAGPDSAT